MLMLEVMLSYVVLSISFDVISYVIVYYVSGGSGFPLVLCERIGKFIAKYSVISIKHLKKLLILFLTSVTR